MSRHLPFLLAASWLLAPGLSRAQDAELTPEKVAAIRRDEQAAKAKVDEEFGNRKPSEMSSEERSQSIAKQESASAGVLEKHGVSAKDYARYEARMSPDDNARAATESKRLETEAAKKAKEAEAKKQAVAEKDADEIPVQEGFSDSNPVELESSEPEGPPTVEVGLPGEEGDGTTPEEPAVEVVTGTAATEQPVAAKSAKSKSASRSGGKKSSDKRRSR